MIEWFCKYGDRNDSSWLVTDFLYEFSREPYHKKLEKIALIKFHDRWSVKHAWHWQLVCPFLARQIVNEEDLTAVVLSWTLSRIYVSVALLQWVLYSLMYRFPSLGRSRTGVNYQSIMSAQYARPSGACYWFWSPDAYQVNFFFSCSAWLSSLRQLCSWKMHGIDRFVEVD